jgi:hypothetical protein
MQKTYNELPSKEIWTERTLDHILQSLEYYWKIGAFRNGDVVLTILEQLIRIVSRVESLAESGFKDEAKEIPFHLYIYPLDTIENYILIQNDEKYMLGLRLFSFNTMITDNPTLCLEAKNWFHSIMRNSNMISNVSAVERRLFFKNAINKITEKEAIVNI